MKRRFHYVGKTAKGGAVFQECGGPHIGIATPLEHGKPLSPGGAVVEIKATDDGHFEVGADEEDKEIDLTGGPSKAVNDAYRSGWDRAFAVDNKDLN